VQRVLIATDSDQVFAEVAAALGSEDRELLRIRDGRSVRSTVTDFEPEIILLDLQIGNMGGVAACLDLRLEMGAGRLEPSPILLLLDRAADTFIAEQSGADSWLIKPLDARRIARAVTATLRGDTMTEGPVEHSLA